ncbi:MAG: FAD-dependent oxidoreductase [Phycisphaerae bacterium]
MPERITCDVLVAGSGAAGIAAAAAAVRCDARVALVEKYGFLGGLATAGQVGTVCGLPPSADALVTPFSGLAFVEEWLTSLALASATQVTSVPGGLRVLPYKQWMFRRLADQLAAPSQLLIPALHATLTDVRIDANGVDARALVWDRVMSFRAKALVDCTGEATAIYLAGGEVIEQETPQTPGVVFTMEGVDAGLQQLSGRLSVMLAAARGGNSGKLSAPARAASFVPGSARDGRVDIKLPCEPGAPADGPLWMTKLEMTARRYVTELSDFLTREVPAFRRARLGQVATQVGVRVGRRANGLKTLTQTDVLECRKCEDGVAWGTWPIEQWNGRRTPRMKPLLDAAYYEIPLGCLRAADIDNAWMAGRCISADGHALASARVIGTALSTGWAAGTAAAYQAIGRTSSEAIKALRGAAAARPGREVECAETPPERQTSKPVRSSDP